MAEKGLIKKTKGKFGAILNLSFFRIFPRPMIQYIKENNRDNNELIGIEIGVLAGKNSLSIFKTLPIKKLYLIDPFEDYEEYKDKYGKQGLNKVFEIAKKRLSKFKDKAVFIKKMSSDAINDIPDDVDFIYIDGNHEYEYVKKDMEIYWRKLRKGGVMGGHDIDNGFCPEHSGVIKAFVEFVKDKSNYFIHCPDWWLVKGDEK